jgi:hypothetical protein
MSPRDDDHDEAPGERLDRVMESVKRIVRGTAYDEFALREEIESRLEDESDDELLQGLYDPML